MTLWIWPSTALSAAQLTGTARAITPTHSSSLCFRRRREPPHSGLPEAQKPRFRFHNISTDEIL